MITAHNYLLWVSLDSYVKLAGYPKILLCDGGSQLIRGCQDMRLSYTETKHQLHKQHQINFEVCSIEGLMNMDRWNGKSERSQPQSICCTKERFSILQCETLATSIANSIDNMPLAINGFGESRYSDSKSSQVGNVILFLKDESKISSIINIELWFQWMWATMRLWEGKVFDMKMQGNRCSVRQVGLQEHLLSFKK